MKAKLGKYSTIKVTANALNPIELLISKFGENTGKAPVEKSFLGYMNKHKFYDTTWDLSGSISFLDNPDDYGKFVTWGRKHILQQTLDDSYPDISITVTDYFNNGSKRIVDYYGCGFSDINFDRDPEIPKEPSVTWHANDTKIIREQ